MGTPLLTEVKIDGTDIKAAGNLIGWEVPDTFGNEIPECKITASASIFDTIPGLENGMSITIKRGEATATEEFVFDGIIDEILKQHPQVVIKGRGKLVYLLRSEITKSYDKDIDTEAGVGSEIFIDMVNSYTPLTADSTSVVSTGTINVITKFICNHVDVFQRGLVLADIYGYQVYHNPDTDKVHFEPAGFIDKTAEILQVGLNVTQTLKYQFDHTQFVNDLTVEGATQETEIEETFSGNSVQTIFTLQFVPIVVRVFVDGNEKTLGVPDSTGAFDYSVDKESKEIRFVSASVPPVGTDNIVVKYTTPKPVPVRVKNSSSIGKYGVSRSTKHFPDVQTVVDARRRGEQFVAKYGIPFVRVKVPVLQTKVKVKAGEIRRVIDAQNDRDDELVVTQVIHRWPETEDIAVCGDREYKTTEWETKTSERIKRLEEEMVKNQDLLVSVETFENDLEAFKRYTKLERRDYTGTTFLIWDHPLYGTWDAQLWGTGDSDVDIGPLVQQRLVWSDGTFEETFYDTEFKDGSTTATWNTATQQLTFAPGQFALSTIVYQDDTTYTAVEVTLDFSGSPTFKVSTDGGSTFTTVTGLQSGIPKAVTITSTPGKELVWRAEGTTGDTITKVQLAPS